MGEPCVVLIPTSKYSYYHHILIVPTTTMNMMKGSHSGGLRFGEAGSPGPIFLAEAHQPGLSSCLISHAPQTRPCRVPSRSPTQRHLSPFPLRLLYDRASMWGALEPHGSMVKQWHPPVPGAFPLHLKLPSSIPHSDGNREWRADPLVPSPSFYPWFFWKKLGAWLLQGPWTTSPVVPEGRSSPIDRQS